MSSRIDLITNDSFIDDAAKSLEIAQQLFQQKHYQKLGVDGILAIMAQAKAIGIDPIRALNGGCYYVAGKVELSAQLMNQLIRKAGHSITVDRKSDDTCYILHGKRADNGDSMMVSFSIEEAKQAGIYNVGNTWKRYPGDMLFARALSRLARRLFADIIGDCYTQDEIKQAIEVEKMEACQSMPSITTDQPSSTPDVDMTVSVPKQDLITEEQTAELMSLITDDELKEKLKTFLYLRFGGQMEAMPSKVAETIISKLKSLQKGDAPCSE